MKQPRLKGMASAMTEPGEDQLHTVAAMTPGRILRLLGEVSDGRAAAMVGVHLAGGQVLTGRLVAVAQDQGHDVVVLHDPRTGALRYALAEHVVAVEVADPARFADVLTAG